jgi:hypothetical protein
LTASDDMAKKKIDPVVAAWRRSLHCLIHPYLPVGETLLEMEGRLQAVKGFLETLDPTDKQQAAQGIEVGALAVTYADGLLDHFGLWDGGSAPPPANLAQARLVVDNVLAFVQGRIAARMMPEPLDDGEADAVVVEDDDDEALAAVVQRVLAGGEVSPSPEPAPETVTPPDDTPPVLDGPAVLVVDRDTFTVRWREKSCYLGHTKEFLLIESLHRRAGRFVPVNDLKDEVWDGDDVEPNTIQQAASSLRRKLKEAGIDGPVIKAERGHYRLTLLTTA